MFHVKQATKDVVRYILVRNLSSQSELYTDESRLYTETGKEFNAHKTVKHSGKEYARREGDKVIHSNRIENVFSIQAWHDWRLSALRRSTSASLPCRIRFQV